MNDLYRKKEPEGGEGNMRVAVGGEAVEKVRFRRRFLACCRDSITPQCYYC